jgi:hypothetical protein
MKHLKLVIILILISTGTAFANPPELSDAKAEAFCVETWTKRGVLDKDMFSYCMDQQRNGYLDAEDQFRKYSGIVPNLDSIVSFAEEKWLRNREYQYSMFAYEFKQQGEAFLDVAYDYKAKKFSEEDMNQCLSKWISDRAPQWTMVAYCLKQN